MYEPIKVTGLREFQRSLAQTKAGLPKALRLALNEAADVVVRAAEPNVPRRTGRAAATLKAKSTQTTSRVAAGSARAPYYPWLDFGGNVGRRHRTHRAFLTRGRYIYPAYDANHDKYEEALSRNLVKVARMAGLAVDEF